MTEEVFQAFTAAEKDLSITRTVQQTPTGRTVIKTFNFVLPPAAKPWLYVFVPGKNGRKDGKDSNVPNKPISKQGIQKMITRLRDVMAKRFNDTKYQDIVSHSERASLAYWMAKESSIPQEAKLRALRMKTPTTLQLYAAKGFARHDMAGVLNQFHATNAIDVLKQHLPSTETRDK